MARIGILAVQGDFDSHRKRLVQLGATPILVKKPAELAAVSGLVLPGGESSTMLKLLGEEFFSDLGKAINDGLPTLATCAGVILLAKKVSCPDQPSLGVIDIDVERNAYGRQIDSFIAQLRWTVRGNDVIKKLGGEKFLAEKEGVEGVFIRAPKISRTGPGVEVLIESDTPNGGALLVQSRNILAATFHPELSENARTIHALFLTSIDGRTIG